MEGIHLVACDDTTLTEQKVVETLRAPIEIRAAWQLLAVFVTVTFVVFVVFLTGCAGGSMGGRLKA